ncbi:MAG: hypothetical protein II767_06335 [Proteobacteria bacterium]|nr:hypothetical protein [Pseudomonadota bacterium]
MRRLVVMVLALIFCVGVPLTAFADNCKNLEKDKKWTEGFKKLNELITDQNWSEALDEAHKLYAYCDRSPLINFYLGHIYQEMGNEKNALNYLRKATDNTDEFAVTGPVLERIWYERYEAEHPDARPENIAKMKEALKNVSAEKMQSEFDSALSLEKVRSNYAAGLWTGVGVGAVGLGLIGAGAGLLSGKFGPLDYNPDSIKPNVSYALGWSFLGAGIAATITGGIVAGIMGYHYGQLKKSDNAVSFLISPTRVSLSYSF